MEHHLRILQKNFSDGKMNRQEFRTHIELEFSRLEDALMNDEITPDQHIKKYNELIEKEAEMHNQMLEINFQNARCTEDTNKNKYVNKKKSAGKVDMVVALINAIYLLQQYLLYGQDDFVVQTA